MLAPVVVKPETVSKNASVYEGISPLMQNGSAPKADMSAHESATITKPSRAYMTFDLGLKSSETRLAASIITTVSAKDHAPPYSP